MQTDDPLIVASELAPCQHLPEIFMLAGSWSILYQSPNRIDRSAYVGLSPPSYFGLTSFGLTSVGLTSVMSSFGVAGLST